MPPTVVATVGTPDANSFQTVAEIDEYYASRVPATVAARWLTSTSKEAAAIDATRWMSSLINWTGYRTSEFQALSWPRINMWTREGQIQVPSNIIPVEIKNGHSELARILLSSDRTAESAIARQGLLGLKAGPITLTFEKGLAKTPEMFPDFIIGLLVPSWIDSIYYRNSGERELRRA